MKRLKTFNELKSSTYDRAGQIAYNRGQGNLAERIWQHGESRRKIEKEGTTSETTEKNKKMVFDMMRQYTFRTHVHSIQEEHRHEDTFCNRVIDITPTQYGLDGSERIWIEFTSEDFNENQKVYFEIDNKKLNLYKNQFTTRRHAVNFIQMLNKIYLLEDPSFAGNAIGKINNVDLKTQLKRNIGGEFFETINIEFGSWDEFKKTIDIRNLYDLFE
tara:strand:- start:32668 stop:33315 length:648 start_codon:yes stop_codon:yes gene_type:complete